MARWLYGYRGMLFAVEISNGTIEICYTTGVKLRSFAAAQEFLYSYIPKEREHRFPGELGLRRARKLLELLGNPQEKVKVVHVAGTSGKGSTAYLTSLLLHTLGFRAGFHVSPHLLDIRERCQIGNRLIGKWKFVDYLNEIVPAIKKMEDTESHSVPFFEDVRERGSTIIARPTYFEILTALAFYIFWQEGVDYAVVETGLGGMYDATNTVKRRDKLCILTRIGKDHTRILGKKLTEIARQKAEIIQEGNTVVALRQECEVNGVIEGIGEIRGADLYWVGENGVFGEVRVGREFSIFNFQFSNIKLKDVELGLLGRHQVENASLALAVVKLLLDKQPVKSGSWEFGIPIRVALRAARFAESLRKDGPLRDALGKANFPGRLEIFSLARPGLARVVVVDGAHNPQKMRALVAGLKELFPGDSFTFLLAFSLFKDAAGMLKHIVPLADKIIVTSFVAKGQDIIRVSQEPTKIEQALRKLKFANYEIVADPKAALKQALAESDSTLAKEGGKLVITGSLYLVGQVYPELREMAK